MNFELLISTMHKNTDEVLKMLEKSNVKCNTLVVVQGDEDGYQEIKKDNQNIRIFFSKDRGLSKSRNLALYNSKADIVLLADDDLYYYDNFEKIILNAFNQNQSADFIIFNIDNYKKKYPSNKQKIFFYNILGISSWQIAFKRQKVIDKKICFDERFGTGSKLYKSGEENIFLSNCYKYFKMIYIPIKILKREESESSWFTGYNEKYLFDRGAIFYTISPFFSYLFILQFAIRRKSLFQNYSFIQILKIMHKGLIDAKKTKGNIQ